MTKILDVPTRKAKPRVTIKGSWETLKGHDLAKMAADGSFDQYITDMQSGRSPYSEMKLSDNMQTGLRVIIRKSKRVTYHAHYTAPEPYGKDEEGIEGGNRPLLKVGTYPKDSVQLVRRRVKTIMTLAENGIDVRRGLNERLMREIDAKGTNWRP